jgi:hypothetical protein
VPKEYENRLGRVTPEVTVPKLREFLKAGGTIVAMGSSTGLAQLMDLGIKNPLTESRPDGSEHPLPMEKFYVPGSVLQVSLDNTRPMAYGMETKADVFFENSPVFQITPEAILKGVRPVAWFADASPLRSGWAWCQSRLDGTVSAAEAELGHGRLYLIGPEAAFRGQSHGTFKLLFNSIYAGSAKATK